MRLRSEGTRFVSARARELARPLTDEPADRAATKRVPRDHQTLREREVCEVNVWWLKDQSRL
jgi:hypothetical protein